MRILLFIFTIFLFSCRESQSPDEKKTGLFAKLTAAKTELNSLDEANVSACIKNYGPGDTTINEFVFQNAVLATEVKDDSNRVLLSFPPPVPPLGLNEYNRVLHPGDSVLYQYKLNVFVLPERKGKYAVRLKGIASEKLVLTVK